MIKYSNKNSTVSGACSSPSDLDEYFYLSSDDDMKEIEDIDVIGDGNEENMPVGEDHDDTETPMDRWPRNPRTNKKITSVKQFDFIDVLHKGCYGQVDLVTVKGSDKEYALKSIKLRYGENDKKKAQPINQMQVMFELRLHEEVWKEGPFVLKLYGHFIEKGVAYFILEYMDMTLHSKLKSCRCKRFQERTAASYVLEVALALYWLHNCSFMHGDLHLKNIFLTPTGAVRLANFGFAWIKYCGGSRVHCRTVKEYLAPEILEGNHYDHRVDLWSLGVLIYQLITGRNPFEANKRSVTYKRIKAVSLKFPPHVSPDARELISKLLVYDPEKRLPLKLAINHKWIMSNYYRYTVD